jgi:hypothetical protein
VDPSSDEHPMQLFLLASKLSSLFNVFTNRCIIRVHWQSIPTFCQHLSSTIGLVSVSHPSLTLPPAPSQVALVKCLTHGCSSVRIRKGCKHHCKERGGCLSHGNMQKELIIQDSLPASFTPPLSLKTQVTQYGVQHSHLFRVPGAPSSHQKPILPLHQLQPEHLTELGLSMPLMFCPSLQSGGPQNIACVRDSGGKTPKNW